MALQFTPGAAPAQPQTLEVQTAAADDAKLEAKIVEVEKQMNIQVQVEDFKSQLANTEEIDKLVSTINANDNSTIIKFGAEAADEVSKASDQVLNSMNMKQINDTGVMFKELKEVMDQFDPEDFEDKPGFWAKFKKKFEKVFEKYDNMGKHIDKIYVQLKQYESEIEGANKKLDEMYDANIGYYQQLVKYIMAGEQGVRELDAYIEEYTKKQEEAPDDGTIRMSLTTLQQSRNMLEARVMDLKVAENVAIQSVPMLKTMEYSNLNLIRKINSAFIITMPVFKQSIAQAMMLRRQRIQAEALQALDEKTNEMLERNATNTVEQSKMIAQMASGSSIKVETLQKTWQTIVSGIDEVKQIEEQAREKRKTDSAELEKIKAEYKAKIKS